MTHVKQKLEYIISELIILGENNTFEIHEVHENNKSKRYINRRWPDIKDKMQWITVWYDNHLYSYDEISSYPPLLTYTTILGDKIWFSTVRTNPFLHHSEISFHINDLIVIL